MNYISQIPSEKGQIPSLVTEMMGLCLAVENIDLKVLINRKTIMISLSILERLKQLFYLFLEQYYQVNTMGNVNVEKHKSSNKQTNQITGNQTQQSILKIKREDFYKLCSAGNQFYKKITDKKISTLSQNQTVDICFFLKKQDNSEYVLLNFMKVIDSQETQTSHLQQNYLLKFCGCGIGDFVNRKDKKQFLRSRVLHSSLFQPQQKTQKCSNIFNTKQIIQKLTSGSSLKKLTIKIMMKEKEENEKGEDEFLGILVEHPHQQLSAEMEIRKQLKKGFSQGQIWTIIHQCLSEMQQFDQMSGKHNYELKKQNIFISKKGDIFISNIASIVKEFTINYDAEVEQKSFCKDKRTYNKNNILILGQIIQEIIKNNQIYSAQLLEIVSLMVAGTCDSYKKLQNLLFFKYSQSKQWKGKVASIPFSSSIKKKEKFQLNSSSCIQSSTNTISLDFSDKFSENSIDDLSSIVLQNSAFFVSNKELQEAVFDKNPNEKQENEEKKMKRVDKLIQKKDRVNVEKQNENKMVQRMRNKTDWKKANDKQNQNEVFWTQKHQIKTNNDRTLCYNRQFLDFLLKKQQKNMIIELSESSHTSQRQSISNFDLES